AAPIGTIAPARPRTGPRAWGQRPRSHGHLGRARRTPTPTAGGRAMTEAADISKRSGAAWLLAPASAVVKTMAVALFAVVLVGSDDDGGTSVTTGEPGESVVLDVELGDLYVEPSSVEVPAGTELIVNVTNAGAMPHDLKLGETGTAMLDPGQSEQVSLGVMEQTTEAWCTVPGHREAGMVLDIVVTGAPASGDHGGGSAAPAGDGAVIDWTATPGADWQPYDPRLEPAP